MLQTQTPTSQRRPARPIQGRPTSIVANLLTLWAEPPLFPPPPLQLIGLDSTRAQQTQGVKISKRREKDRSFEKHYINMNKKSAHTPLEKTLKLQNFALHECCN